LAEGRSKTLETAVPVWEQVDGLPCALHRAWYAADIEADGYEARFVERDLADAAERVANLRLKAAAFVDRMAGVAGYDKVGGFESRV